MVEDVKLPNIGISYTVAELAAKAGVAKPEAAPMKKISTGAAKSPAKSPAMKSAKSPAMKRGKSPATSMKKAKK